MAFPNIEKFNEIVGRVFSRLYVNFPLPTSLTVDFLVAEGRGLCDAGQNLMVLDAEGEFAFACVNWLVDAGYISATNDEQSLLFVNAVLTAKGLESLKQTPSSLSASFGEQIDAALKKGSVDALRNLTSKALTQSLPVIFGLSHLIQK